VGLSEDVLRNEIPGTVQEGAPARVELRWNIGENVTRVVCCGRRSSDMFNVRYGVRRTLVVRDTDRLGDGQCVM
jgi:hypothetical protein